jgi:hypothetical protein
VVLLTSSADLEADFAGASIKTFRQAPLFCSLYRIGRTYSANRDTHAVTDAFAAEWLHSIEPRFTHARLPLVSLSKDAFNTLVRPFSDVVDTAALLIKRLHGLAMSERYHPGKRPGLTHDENGSFINTYTHSPVRDYSAEELNELRRREPEFAKPFENFLTQLIPNEKEREFLADWIATVMACPSVKLTVAVLLVGVTQGVGKTTLCHILAEVLGWKNTTLMQLSALLKSEFRAFAEKQLVIISEIQETHAGREVYDKTQEYISDRFAKVRKLYCEGYDAKNFANWISCTNSERAIQFPNEDRRWFIAAVTDLLQSKEWWDWFNDWLGNQDGYRKVRQWAKDRVESRGALKPSDRAPYTPAKKDMFIASLFEEGQFVRAMFDWVIRLRRRDIEDDELEHQPEMRKLAELARKESVHFVMMDRDGVQAVKSIHYRGSPPNNKTIGAQKVRQIAERAGLGVSKRIWDRGYFKYVISTSMELTELPPDDLVAGLKQIRGHPEGSVVELELTSGPIKIVGLDLISVATEIAPL